MITTALLTLLLAVSPTAKVEGTLWLDGDSTLHRYRIDAKEFSAQVRLSETVPQPLDAQHSEALLRPDAVAALELTVPVTKLSSGDNAMDQNLRRALQIGKQPDIVFHLDSYRVSPVNGTQNFTLELHGKLGIAGVERSITVLGIAKLSAAGLHVTGKCPISMAEFGVKPPVVMGLLKTADKIVVNFDVMLL